MFMIIDMFSEIANKKQNKGKSSFSYQMRLQGYRSKFVVSSKADKTKNVPLFTKILQSSRVYAIFKPLRFFKYRY